MRSLEDVTLPLDGLTVLVGENGSGKSTIIEALEILRKAAQSGEFVSDHLLPKHGDLLSLLRKGERELSLEVGLQLHGEGDEEPVSVKYGFEVGWDGARAGVTKEWLSAAGADDVHAVPYLKRDRTQLLVRKQGKLVDLVGGPGPAALSLVWSEADTYLRRVRAALEAGAVHLPFEVRPYWLARERKLEAPLREPAQLSRSAQLKRLGENLANAYYELRETRSRSEWEDTLALVRAGLGDRVLDIKFPAAQPGAVSLALELRGLPEPVTTMALSDGQLSYLAFVALRQLGMDHSFIAFDEPDVHLHPALLVRVVWMFEELAAKRPVVLATQSDRLLDSLESPADAVVVCELNERCATRLHRLDGGALKKWMENYAGVGAIRSDGYLDHLVQAQPSKTLPAPASTRPVSMS